jgi:hypothetical protein
MSETSLSSIGFNNMNGGTYGFNKETGDAALGFTTNLAFFCQLISLIGFCIFGTLMGRQMIKDSKKYTEKIEATITDINCKEKRESQGDRRSSVTYTKYECENTLNYKLGNKVYKNRLITEHDFDQELDKDEVRQKNIYYDPNNPEDIIEKVPNREMGMGVIFCTVLCFSLCLYFLNLCYKSLGCRAYMAFDFVFGDSRNDYMF